jgi:hypothetical protein
LLNPLRLDECVCRIDHGADCLVGR